MKYNNETRSKKSNLNKEKICKSAMKLISEKGYDNVSIQEITKEAGVSKGAFYIHFSSKEDLIEKNISYYYDDMKLDDSHSVYERLQIFLDKSITHIIDTGLKMAQEWFSHSVTSSVYGMKKLEYDLSYVKEILSDEMLAKEVISVYYGALNLWCFTNGMIDPLDICMNYLEKFKRC